MFCHCRDVTVVSLYRVSYCLALLRIYNTNIVSYASRQSVLTRIFLLKFSLIVSITSVNVSTFSSIEDIDWYVLYVKSQSQVLTLLK